MHLLAKLFLLLGVMPVLVKLLPGQYTPDWNSLDTRPLPTWYDDAKVGIFIHWGVFSVPSYRSEWFWWDWQGDKPTQDVVDFMNKNYQPGFTYADFGSQFQAEFFNPDDWADLFNASGAKYIVLTSKHHEGYCLWPSKNSFNWNSMDVGPKRDLVNDLAKSIRNRTSIRFGLYHSLFEWFNPLYLSDKAQSFATQDFVKYKTMPELYDIVNKYKPEVIWSDGDWETSAAYWNSTEFIAWLYNESPVKDTIVTNDRWGSEVLCKHGDIYTCSDNYNPGVLIKHKWENCMPLDSDSWGYRRNMKLTDVRSIDYVLKSLVETVSCGGNILINIGPTKEGTIAPVFEERLRQMGYWLKVNGEAIYGTTTWKYQNDTTNPDVWYTSSKTEPIVYAILLQDPIASTKLTLTAPTTTGSTQITLLGFDGPIEWVAAPKTGLVIDLGTVNFQEVKSKWAFVFKMENLM